MTTKDRFLMAFYGATGQKAQLLKAVNRVIPIGELFSQPSERNNMIGKAQPGNYESHLNSNTSWVYAATSCIASNVAKIPLHLYSKSTNKTGKTIWNEVYEHPFLELYKRVNPHMGSFELNELTQLHLDLTGNAFWYLVPNRVGLPQEVWVLMPHKVQVVPGGSEFIAGYLYTTPTGEKIAFETKEILHFKYPNPLNMYYGMSPIDAILYAVNANESMQRYTFKMFQNDAFLGTVATVQTRLAEREFKRLRTEFEEARTGLRKAGRPMLLEAGVKLERAGQTMRELEFPEGRSMTRDEILAIYGVPLTKLGFGADTNRATAFELDKTFQKETILPRLIRKANRLNEFLLPLWDAKLECEFENPTPVDQDIAMQQRDIDLGKGVVTINEVREEDGKEPVDWGDVPILPMGMMPIDAKVRGQLTQNQTGAPDKTPPDNPAGGGKTIKKKSFLHGIRLIRNENG